MFRRFLQLGFGSWKKRRQRGTYLSFYLQNPGDGRNKLARWLDLLGILLVTWLVSFTLLSGYTKNQKALLFSAALLIIAAVFTDIIKRVQLQKRLERSRRELAKKQHQEEIEQLENSEFGNYAQKLLEQYGVEFQAAGGGEEIPEHAFQAVFEQAPVLVRFLDGEDAGSVFQAEEIAASLSNSDYHAVILVLRNETAPEFKYIVESNTGMHVEVVDKNRLAGLAARVEKEEKDEAAEEGFSRLEKHQRNVRKWSYLKNQFWGTRTKTRGYALTGVMLFLFFFYWNTGPVLSMVYLTFALINLGLSVISFTAERNRARAQLLKP